MNILRRIFDAMSSPGVLLALVTYLGLQYYLRPVEYDKVESGLVQHIPKFSVHGHQADAELVKVSTDLADYEFSPQGAILQKVSYKHHLGKDGLPLSPVIAPGDFNREHGLFALEVADESPWLYKHESTQVIDDHIMVTFTAHAGSLGWKITKTFIIDKNGYRIEGKMSFDKLRKDASVLHPRIYLSNPWLTELAKEDVKLMMWNNDDAKPEKITKTNDQAWRNATIIGVDDKYFLHAITSMEQGSFRQAYALEQHTSQTMVSVVEFTGIEETSAFNFEAYVGPKVYKYLDKVNTRLISTLSLGWFSVVSKFLGRVLQELYDVVGNYGVAIILLTLCIRVPLIPLFLYGKKRMAIFEAFNQKNKYAIEAIKNKNRGNMVQQQEELTKFYSDHGINGTSAMFYGLMPNLVSIPVFLGLYSLLNNAIMLYQAPFCLWIKDLGSADPYYVLPLLMGGVVVFQQLQMPITDRSMYVMRIVMPVMLLGLFANMPVGILLYIGVQFIITALEEVIKRKRWLTV